MLDDPQSWRRSQLATVGVIAAILLLAGLGVVLWNLLADEPDSLATVPERVEHDRRRTVLRADGVDAATNDVAAPRAPPDRGRCPT